MNKVIGAKYSKGIIKLSGKHNLPEGKELYVVVEENEKTDILDETFGIWMDTSDYLDRMRNESENRIKTLGLS